jgi:hypothetical protein
VARFELLQDVGATPRAFNFKSAFDAHGAPIIVDKARARRLATNTRP